MKQFDVEKTEKEELIPRKEQKSSFLPVVFGIVLGLVISLGAMYLLVGRTINLQSNKNASQPETEKQTETTNTTQTEEVSPPTPTQPETETPTSENPKTLNKSQVKIQLLNGNGIKGDALKVKTILEKDGWKVASYGNARSFNYQNTLVYYKEEQEEAAKAVADILKNNDRQTALHKSDSLTTYDIQIILGKKYL